VSCSALAGLLVAEPLGDPELLRTDQFESFYEARRKALLSLVTTAMGKAAIESPELVADDNEDDGKQEVDTDSSSTA
jgi:hypothetical protein